MKKKKIEVGDEFTINEGGRVVVVEYGGCSNVLVKHLDDYGHEMVVEVGHLRAGKVKNPYHPSVHGVGFVGVGEYKPSEGRKNTKEYSTWNSMFARCYCPKLHEKYPTYVGCSVDKRWHNFQVFAKWFNEQHRADDWQLDKDLIEEGNKIYTPELCRFIPQDLNKLLTDSGRTRGDLPQGVTRDGSGYRAQLNVDGTRLYLGTYPTETHAFAVYKKAKEENIRRMANIYKDEICPLIFEALMIYEVNYDI